MAHRGEPASSADRPLAVVNAISLAAVIAHFSAWPRRTRFGLPWLEDCEGLGPELMPIYNPVLYLSGAAALGALLAENPTASRRLPLLVVAATVPVLVRAQHGEFRRLQQRAQRTPGRWNRRLRPRTT